MKSALLFLPLACACASQPKTEAAPEDPVARVDRLLPKAESLSAFAVAVRLEVENPRVEALTIKQIEWALDTGELAGVIKGNTDSDASLEPSQKGELEFRQSIPYPEDKDAYRALFDKGSLPLDLKGTVTFTDGTQVAFEKKGSVAMPRLPKLVVNDAQAARYGKEGLDVTIFLRLINENDFAVNIGGVNYTVSINGQELKSEQGGIGVRLAQGAAQEFEVGIVLEEKTFKGTKDILAAGKLEYAVKGMIDVAGLELPFEHGDEIKLAQSEEE